MNGSAPSLEQYLDEMRYWELLAMARARALPLATPRPPKADLVRALSDFLVLPAELGRELRALAPAAREALQSLLAAGGSLPWEPFRARYGEVRPIQTNRDGVSLEPALLPASTAEALAYRGLILRLPYRPRPGEPGHARIPTEIQPFLAERLARPLPIEQLEPPPLALPRVLDDLVTLLSLLHHEEVRPGHGRWLAPALIHRWNERSSAPEPLGRLRHERQAPRYAFLHLLAEAAGLVAPLGGWLKPTVAGWQWLFAPLEARYRQLWEGWLAAASGPLWERYRQPGASQPDPAALLQRLLAALASLAPGERLPLRALADRLLRADPLFWQESTFWEDEAQPRAWVAELVRGPLRWWQALSIEGGGEEATLTLTTLGGWLLAGEGRLPPFYGDDPPATLDDGGQLLLPLTLPPIQRLHIESMALWRGWEGEARAYQLTPASVVGAQRHLEAGALLHELDRALGHRLTAAQRARIEGWIGESQRLRLRHMTVLESPDSATLRRLGRRRGVRRYLRRSLSPRHVEVAEHELPALRRALRAAGHPLPPAEPSPPAPALRLEVDGATAAHLLVAARLYRALGEWISLPLPLPPALLDQLDRALDERARTAVSHAVEGALADLTYAMEGYAPRPMPGEGLPLAESLPRIEVAIAAGSTLEIDYWAAGRGALTHRRIDPHRIEQLGAVPYLLAWCHAAEQSLLFRVDRLAAIRDGDGDDAGENG